MVRCAKQRSHNESASMGTEERRGGEGAGPERGCLIVEDRPDTRAWLGEVVAEAFPDMGQAAVGSLREARGWLKSQAAQPAWRLALVLIDLGLPDGSGVALIGEV